MMPLANLPRNEVLLGNALDRLRQLPDRSVDMVLTSPPYFRLRDYAADGQLGLEAHVEEWIKQLAEISAEVHRVLVPTGTYWLNLGDTFATHQSEGAARKSLLMAPERLALRLQQSGWIIRNKIVWAKPNPMPTSIKDRLNCTYEFVYVLAKQPEYFFDLDAIRVPHRSALTRPRALKARAVERWRGPNGDTVAGLDVLKAEGRVGHPLGKNPGDVWQIATRAVPGHHAVFPARLAAQALQAGCPEARCARCRKPWRRRVIRTLGGTATRAALGPTCACGAPSEVGLVLDPFFGSGTTAVAAEQLQRHWLGIELNPDFAALAERRITAARQDRRPPPRGLHGEAVA
ncbi:DNA modification methylase [Mycobacteroides abscessus subsp. abscessus]|uniref:DNA-methyltransferase n=1 Tax=Mycobacteroides abscessus TaxID=36809 RepID=UPI00092A5206|nr:site-specific DNA-methyltransferase [Mycobacteroides abscessus]SHV15316.1 DNA modification methylase [Mycobacteroides abscessus subsp. abscessus]SKD11180.1 DNA modification methylase [Mycobacteroides abscessus subsp. abscessus]SKL38108.1 DNA modification methylase [Mycobacteroides abscessus subsp. abscessus]SKM28361.1 DNA modification methylase [Mycobacteroides abscessus subsp. abscessus]